MGLLDARPAWQIPVQWPDGASASAAGRVVRERLLKAGILFAMLALTVLDQFGLQVMGRSSVPVSMIAMYALAAAMLTAGAAELNARGTLGYLAVVFLAALSVMVNAAFVPPPFLSKLSFLFLVAIYAPLCVSLRRGSVGPELWRWTLKLYVAFALFIGAAGIAQYAIQFAFRPPWLFDYARLIPEVLRHTGFNTEIVVQTATSAGKWAKSNGFFMREPSIFSIIMAFGLLCELSLARRKWVIVVFALGLAVSYSGSGLLCLAVALLVPLGRRTAARILVFAALAAALFFLFADVLNLSYTLNRSGELFTKNTSGYCRFTAPTVEVLRMINSDPWTSVLGHGPGSMSRMSTECAGTTTTYAKALFEYGLAGTAAICVMMLGALNRSSAPVQIRVAAGVTWLLLGGNLLDSMFLLFIYVISAMWPEGTARAAAPSAQR
jgi:hypothetical protein